METCSSCSKKVYVIEKTEANGRAYHKTCFKVNFMTATDQETLSCRELVLTLSFLYY